MDNERNDDPTQDQPDEANRTTQPTIMSVFELVHELKLSVDGINARLDATNARLDATNARLDELSEVVKSGFMTLEDKIDRSALHSEADYHDLRKRMRDLESKAS